MVDLHVHILPGVDDGAQDMDMALEMAALAVESGVKMLAATPHSSANGRIQNHFDAKYRSVLKSLESQLIRAGIVLDVVPGMEIYGTFEVPRLLKEKKLIGLNGSRYPLIEFPFSDYAIEATEILEEILKLGMIPIVAHPERYEYVQDDPHLLNLWMDMGCLFQINKGSLMGRFGWREEKLAMEMLQRGFVCAVASDAHTSTVRSTWMKDVYSLICNECSEELAKAVLDERPRRILEDQEIVMSEPEWF